MSEYGLGADHGRSSHSSNRANRAQGTLNANVKEERSCVLRLLPRNRRSIQAKPLHYHNIPAY